MRLRCVIYESLGDCERLSAKRDKAVKDYVSAKDFMLACPGIQATWTIDVVEVGWPHEPGGKSRSSWSRVCQSTS